jgi:hypothetical protein
MKRNFNNLTKILLFSASISTSIYIAVFQSRNVVDSRVVLIFLSAAILVYVAEILYLLSFVPDDLNVDEDYRYSTYRIYNFFVIPILAITSTFMLGMIAEVNIFVFILFLLSLLFFIYLYNIESFVGKSHNKEIFIEHSIYDLAHLFVTFVISNILLISIASDPYGSVLTILISFFPLFMISFASLMKVSSQHKSVVLSIITPLVFVMLLIVLNSAKVFSSFQFLESVAITLIFFILVRFGVDFLTKKLTKNVIMLRIVSLALIIALILL